MTIRATDSIIMCALSMVVLRTRLSFNPATNALIGGAVGGYRTGSARRGIAASLLPALAIGPLTWAVLRLCKAPALGVLGGVAVGTWALFASRGMVIGAAFGGALANARVQRRTLSTRIVPKSFADQDFENQYVDGRNRLVG